MTMANGATSGPVVCVIGETTQRSIGRGHGPMGSAGPLKSTSFGAA